MYTTEKLYDLDAYGKEFTAQILDIRLEEDGTDQTLCADIILDKTYFFPEGGGQSGDCGTLAGFPVVDTQIRDGVIRHRIRCTGEELQSAGIYIGAKVQGCVDFARRFVFMQHHTGEHILSGLMHSKYGFDNVGFRLSDHTCTLDVNGQLDDAQILELEREANEVVFGNVPVRVSYPDDTTLKELPYRSKIEIEEAVRIVDIEGVDLCACCAPHVETTGEIGLIKIVKVLHSKDSMRLWILCGRRAVLEMQKRQRILESISHATNRPQEEADSAVGALQEEISQLRQRVRDLAYEAAFLRIENIPGDQRDVYLFVPPMEPIVQRNLVNKLVAEHGGICGVFAGSDDDGYRYILASASEDSRRANQLLKDQFMAKGGGKPAMVQGSCMGCEEEIRTGLEKL